MKWLLYSFVMMVIPFVSAMDGLGDTCQTPGTCVPPSALYSRRLNVPARIQWWTDGGYCGSVSIQSNALNFGVWISEALIRKAAPNGGGHGNPSAGYEILHTNIETALQSLKLTYNAWPYKTAPQPQYPAYLQWLKQELVAGHPIVVFVLCSGDRHNSYGLAEYDHIEPVFGIYSNSSLETDGDTVFPDDVLVHGSDWDQFGYYRRFDTMVDSAKHGSKLTGNCSKAAAHGGGANEAYPCFMDDINYGYAITGFVDPLERSVYTSLSVDGDGAEPQQGSLALTGTVTVHGPLTRSSSYTIFRFDGTTSFPTNSLFEKGNYTSRFQFVATNDSTFNWVDPTPIPSNTAVYYVTLLSSSVDDDIDETDSIVVVN